MSVLMLTALPGLREPSAFTREVATALDALEVLRLDARAHVTVLVLRVAYLPDHLPSFLLEVLSGHAQRPAQLAFTTEVERLTGTRLPALRLDVRYLNLDLNGQVIGLHHPPPDVPAWLETYAARGGVADVETGSDLRALFADGPSRCAFPDTLPLPDLPF